MSRLSTLANLLHSHADRAESNPHPIHLAESVAAVFRAIGRELQAAHDQVEKSLSEVAAMTQEDIERVLAGFRAGVNGELTAAAPAPAPDAPEISQPEAADLVERAERMHVAFRERASVLGIAMPTWDTLDEGLRSCWVAAAGAV